MYEELKRSVVKVFKYMEKKGWNHGKAGNISVFVRERKHILVTPSGVSKAKLKPEDVLVLDVDGNVLEGRGKPTVELPFHLAIYKAYDYINVVVHAHGVYSTVLSVVREPLPPLIEEMIMYVGGEVRVAEYAPSGTGELAENVVKALEGRKAVILANHGVVACGKDFEEAVEILGLVERLSQVYILAKLLGKFHQLPQDVVEFHRKTFLNKLRR